MIKIPSNIADICVRLETRQALTWQVANELDVSHRDIYRWYRFYRGKGLSDVTGHRRGKVMPQGNTAKERGHLKETKQ